MDKTSLNHVTIRICREYFDTDCAESNICYEESQLNVDKNNKVSLYINQQWGIFDATLGKEVSKERPPLDPDTGKITEIEGDEFPEVVGKLVQDQIVLDETVIVSPWMNDLKNTTLIIFYLKEIGTKLIITLKQKDRNESRQLDSEDILGPKKYTCFQEMLTHENWAEYIITNEIVISKFDVTFPKNWTGEKRIEVRAGKHVQIINIWEGGSSEPLKIYDDSCDGLPMPIYGVALGPVKTINSIDTVSKCINGGTRNKVTETCDCPPGFTGDACENVCGENKFGRQCSGQCSPTDIGCKGVVLCVPDFDCSCAAGFRGDYCSEECGLGFYHRF